MTERTSREDEATEANELRPQEARSSDGRPSDAWVPAGSLPDPDPQDGYVFRWIRTAIMGEADNKNVSMRFREGWEPVKASEHPELKILSDIGSRFDGCIEVGGQLLCKAPAEMIRQRQDHYRQKASLQMQSVDNEYMAQNDPRMPMLEPQRRTKRGGKLTFGQD